MNNSIKYSIQLAMLKRLIDEEHISQFEYDLIKEKVKKRCKIVEEALI